MSGDHDRHHKEIEMGNINVVAAALILIGIGAWAVTVPLRVDASPAAVNTGIVFPWPSDAH